jgi:hypothetical protein
MGALAVFCARLPTAHNAAQKNRTAETLIALVDCIACITTPWPLLRVFSPTQCDCNATWYGVGLSWGDGNIENNGI